MRKFTFNLGQALGLLAVALLSQAAALAKPALSGELIYANQCAKCHGDCEDEEGCEDGLFCFRRNEFELVPGCAGQGTFGTNYCFDPADLEKLWGDSRDEDEDDRRHS